MFIFFLIIINLFIFYHLKKISKILNIYDLPDGRLKLHRKKTPLLGGFILAINFLFILIYQIIFSKNFLFLEIEQINNLELFSILFLIYGNFILGLYDDKYQLTPSKKIILSIVVILIAVFLNKNLIITNFTLSFYENKIFFENFSIVFTVFCILTLINALNFYDGINGQSCVIFLFFFSYLFLRSDLNFFYLVSVIPILMIMIINFRNSLFLGDSGIYLLSSILSISLIYEHNVQKSIIYADEIFLLLLLPGIDLLRLSLTRSLKSKNPLFGDRDHIHHLLINKFSLTFSNLVLLLFSILPITLWIFLKLNFFLVFSIFLILYIFLIQFLKLNDKRYK